MSGRKSAYDKHWERLAELLGPEEAAAERARMTADEREDTHRRTLARYRQQMPRLKEELARAERDGKEGGAKRLRKQIADREQALAKAREEEERDV